MAILIAGAGVASVFWKMPAGNEVHALYYEGVVDRNLAAAPLPSESIALFNVKEREEIMLPPPSVAPAMDSGLDKYAQAYPAPASLLVLNAESGRTVSPASAVKEQSASPSAIPQRMEPMRQTIEERPISIEPVNRDFPPKPDSVSITEKSDEMLSEFHFAANSRASLDHLAEPAPPTDPFPTDSFPVAAATATSMLQPLKPLQLNGLSPLLPLSEAELQSFPTLIAQ
jgi:hypothetical protein